MCKDEELERSFLFPKDECSCWLILMRLAYSSFSCCSSKIFSISSYFLRSDSSRRRCFSNFYLSSASSRRFYSSKIRFSSAAAASAASRAKFCYFFLRSASWAAASSRAYLYSLCLRSFSSRRFYSSWAAAASRANLYSSKIFYFSASRFISSSCFFYFSAFLRFEISSSSSLSSPKSSLLLIFILFFSPCGVSANTSSS